LQPQLQYCGPGTASHTPSLLKPILSLELFDPISALNAVFSSFVEDGVMTSGDVNIVEHMLETGYHFARVQVQGVGLAG
jgi:hypothetical protein